MRIPAEATAALESTPTGLIFKVDGKPVPGVTSVEVIHSDHGQYVVVKLPMRAVRTDDTGTWARPAVSITVRQARDTSAPL